MGFNTEMEITLPSVREEDYYSSIQYNVGKFLGKVPKAYLENVTVKYLPGKGHNLVTVSWPQSILGETSDSTSEETLIKASKRVSYWFRHCKFFRKHGVRNFFTYFDN